MPVITNLFTGKDNTTHDIGRWSWAISLFGVFAFAAANIVLGKEVDLSALGTAVAAVVGAHGAALWAKKESEPQ